jgi:hypothetical protein
MQDLLQTENCDHLPPSNQRDLAKMYNSLNLFKSPRIAPPPPSSPVHYAIQDAIFHLANSTNYVVTLKNLKHGDKTSQLPDGQGHVKQWRDRSGRKKRGQGSIVPYIDRSYLSQSNRQE